MNNLSEMMQERLDKWKANTLPVKAADKVRPSTSKAQENEAWHKQYKERMNESSS